MDVKYVGMEWIPLAQYRVQCLALAKKCNEAYSPERLGIY